MMPGTVDIVIDGGGCIRAIYDERFDLAILGDMQIRRVSHVEPDDRGRWFADLSPVQGPTLGPFDKRSAALEAELSWLRLHCTTTTPSKGIAT